MHAEGDAGAVVQARAKAGAVQLITWEGERQGGQPGGVFSSPSSSSGMLTAFMLDLLSSKSVFNTVRLVIYVHMHFDKNTEEASKFW